MVLDDERKAKVESLLRVAVLVSGWFGFGARSLAPCLTALRFGFSGSSGGHGATNLVYLK